MQLTSPAPDRQEGNLLHAIAARARRTSDAALVACAVAGLVAAGGLAWMEGRGWGILLPTVALGLWGGWGVVDRTLRERALLRDERTQPEPPSMMDSALRATRVALAVAGIATGIAGALALLGMLLGRIIS